MGSSESALRHSAIRTPNSALAASLYGRTCLARPISPKARQALGYQGNTQSPRPQTLAQVGARLALSELRANQFAPSFRPNPHSRQHLPARPRAWRAAPNSGSARQVKPSRNSPGRPHFPMLCAPVSHRRIIRRPRWPAHLSITAVTRCSTSATLGISVRER